MNTHRSPNRRTSSSTSHSTFSVGSEMSISGIAQSSAMPVTVSCQMAELTVSTASRAPNTVRL